MCHRFSAAAALRSACVRQLRIGVDDGSGDVFIGDPSIPITSDLGVELLAVNAELMECWQEIAANRAFGLATIHHEENFEELAERHHELKAAIRASGDDRA
jgi:hypothetical protein